MKEIFALSPYRFLCWLWCLVRLQGPFYLMTAAALLLFSSLIYGVCRNIGIILHLFFYIFLLCGCVIWFICVSREVNNKNTNILWFMLPVSVLERYLAFFLMGTVLVPLTMITGFSFLAQIQEPDSLLFKNIDWNIVLKYLYVQPFFLFAAIYFKNKGLLKTLALLCIVLVVSTGWMDELFLKAYSHFNHEILAADYDKLLQRISRSQWTWFFTKIVWDWLTPIFFSILGFLCLKEKEVHNDASN